MTQSSMKPVVGVKSGWIVNNRETSAHQHTVPPPSEVGDRNMNNSTYKGEGSIFQCVCGRKAYLHWEWSNSLGWYYRWYLATEDNQIAYETYKYGWRKRKTGRSPAPFIQNGRGNTYTDWGPG